MSAVTVTSIGPRDRHGWRAFHIARQSGGPLMVRSNGTALSVYTPEGRRIHPKNLTDIARAVRAARGSATQ
jgi:hypothetical protein